MEVIFVIIVLLVIIGLVVEYWEVILSIIVGIIGILITGWILWLILKAFWMPILGFCAYIGACFSSGSAIQSYIRGRKLPSTEQKHDGNIPFLIFGAIILLLVGLASCHLQVFEREVSESTYYAEPTPTSTPPPEPTPTVTPTSTPMPGQELVNVDISQFFDPPGYATPRPHVFRSVVPEHGIEVLIKRLQEVKDPAIQYRYVHEYESLLNDRLEREIQDRKNQIKRGARVINQDLWQKGLLEPYGKPEQREKLVSLLSESSGWRGVEGQSQGEPFFFEPVAMAKIEELFKILPYELYPVQIAGAPFSDMIEELRTEKDPYRAETLLKWYLQKRLPQLNNQLESDIRLRIREVGTERLFFDIDQALEQLYGRDHEYKAANAYLQEQVDRLDQKIIEIETKLPNLSPEIQSSYTKILRMGRGQQDALVSLNEDLKSLRSIRDARLKSIRQALDFYSRSRSIQGEKQALDELLRFFEDIN
jgi:hypothetical protein